MYFRKTLGGMGGLHCNLPARNRSDPKWCIPHRTKIPETDQIAAHLYVRRLWAFIPWWGWFWNTEKNSPEPLDHKQEYLSYSYQQNHSNIIFRKHKMQNLQSNIVRCHWIQCFYSVSYSNDDYISSIQITYIWKMGVKWCAAMKFR